MFVLFRIWIAGSVCEFNVQKFKLLRLTALEPETQDAGLCV